MKSFNLSDKIYGIKENWIDNRGISVEDVREFIKLIKKRLVIMTDSPSDVILNELAGEKLIVPQNHTAKERVGSSEGVDSPKEDILLSSFKHKQKQVEELFKKGSSKDDYKEERQRWRKERQDQHKFIKKRKRRKS